MPDLPPQHLDLEQGVDRKQLRQIRDRFLQLNQVRLGRTRASLGTRQQLVLDLLPLLFAVNHPLLPGFSGSDTPCGISNYRPSKILLQSARRIARSFEPPYIPPNAPRAIHSLLLMGSCGSIGHSSDSDLDIWICHDPGLSAQACAKLAAKAEGISFWAASWQLEVHFFLIDAERFRRREHTAELAAEHCGSTQHYLLLDEFYRTALLLAGRYPIWWLVPPEQEPQYEQITQALVHKRFVKPGETIDLGSPATIPAGEFIGAGLWHLYKAIKAPYKALLKLLLTELYAQQQELEPLAQTYKRRVYSGELDPDRLDPYVLLYRRLEDHLDTPAFADRLELVRRALYFKSEIALSRRRAQDWQRQLLGQLTRNWGWSDTALRDLDDRSQWRSDRVEPEYQRLVNELLSSYRFLNQWSRLQPDLKRCVSERDMTLLGRRLYAAFERRAGKLSRINLAISDSLLEAHVTLAQRGEHWLLWQGHRAFDELAYSPALLPPQPLLGLLGWCHLNQVIGPQTRITLYPGDSALTEAELTLLLRSLAQEMPLGKASLLSDQAFLQPAQPTRWLLVVNAGCDPLAQLSRRGQQLLTSRTDALAYSGLLKQNLVVELDLIESNSWQEWRHQHYQGDTALLDWLHDYLSLPLPPQFGLVCHCRNRAGSIHERLQRLLLDLQEFFLQDREADGRYLLEVRDRLQLIERRKGKIRIRSLKDRTQLLQALGEVQAQFSPIHLDRQALAGDELHLVLQQNRPQAVQIFYREDDQGVQLYLLDELGALFAQRYVEQSAEQILRPLSAFLGSISLRQSTAQTAPELELYELLGQQFQPRNWPGTRALFGFEVQVLINGHEPHQLSIFTGSRLFDGQQLGERLYQEVAGTILQGRRDRAAYPCHITDLDLSGLYPEAGSAQTLAYLHYKREIERSLNQALEQQAARR